MKAKHYGMTGAARKPLLRAIEKSLGIKGIYAKVPTCAYHIGTVTLSKDGVVSAEDDDLLESLASDLLAAGFRAEEDDTDDETHAEENADDTDRFTISLPREGFSELALEHLRAIVETKDGIIRKALAADSTEVLTDAEKITFPWFSRIPSPEEISAYTTFIAMLAKYAKDARRVTAKEHAVENEKYYFRCFLLRLGLIGPEYKSARKILLQNLEGSSAFRVKKEAP